MKQHRLNAYLKLIQELLACPNGEEWIRLKQHEDLVDAELIQVMEQLASQLLQEGNRQAAIFLHNWAAKLHHILVKEKQPTQSNDDASQAYLSLIQSLLECSEDAKEKLLAEHRHLIGPGLVHTMKQVAQQLRQNGSNDSATYLQNLAAQLNQAWIEAHDFQPKLNKKAPNTPFKTNDSTVAFEVEAPPPDSEAKSPTNGSDQETASSSSSITAFSLSIQQQLANAIHEMSQALYQLNQTLSNQHTHATSSNPLWYMDVLERAATAQWLLTTDEIEQLISVKPKCQSKDKTYQRGIWTFMKVGKLGAQTAWKVTKTKLSNPVLNSDADEIKHHSTDDHDRATAMTSVESLAKHPPLKQTALSNGSSDSEQRSLEIPEMDDVWA